MEIKSGIKTTEFYVALFAPAIVSALVLIGQVDSSNQDQVIEMVKQVMVGVVSLFSALGYMKFRRDVKVEAMRSNNSSEPKVGGVDGTNLG